MIERMGKEYFDRVKRELINRLKEIKYDGDIKEISDIGNEIGIIIGDKIATEKDYKDQRASFEAGLAHGFSLMDETHNKEADNKGVPYEDEDLVWYGACNDDGWYEAESCKYEILYTGSDRVPIFRTEEECNEWCNDEPWVPEEE